MTTHDAGDNGEGRDLPFAGVRVLDLTSTLAGAIASMYLGDFGADVVRIEAAPVDRPEGVPAYLYANRSKRIVPLDWSTYDGLHAVRSLSRRADAVVVDAPSSTIERFGLDSTTLRSEHTRLVHLWMPAHGHRGRGSELPAQDLLLAARTGVADQQPATRDQPVALVVPVLSYEHGALGATAIAAALLGRERTGDGRAVVVSGLHAVAALNGSFMVDLPGGGIIRPFGGSKGGSGLAPNYRAYECRDGRWIFLATLTPAFFFKALDALGLMEVMVLPGIDGDFANVRRPDRHAPVGDLMTARMKEKARDEWQAIFERAGVPAAPVDDRAAWLRSETVAANGALVTLEHDELGPVRLPGVPVSLSLTPGRVSHLPDRRGLVDITDVWADALEPAAPPASGSAMHPDRLGSSNAQDGQDAQSDLDGSGGARHPDVSDRPLSGLYVLDLGSFLAGPLAAEILTDFGATVVKVEHPDGDGYRASAATYAATNRGKSNLSIDLKEEAGRAVLSRLARRADVVIDNVRAGVPERLGTDYESLRRINPAIVRCTITGWGAGPLRDTPCFDPLLQARGGLMAAQAGDGAPVLYAMPVHDVGCGTMGTFGVLAALLARRRSGSGQEVRTSLAHVSLAMQAGESTWFSGRPDPMIGGTDFLGPSDVQRLYRCADGWIALDAGHAGASALRAALDRPEGQGAGRHDSEYEAAFATRSVEETLDRLSAAGVPSVAVLGRDDIFRDPWLAENDFYVDVKDADVGWVQTVAGFADWVDVPARRTMTSRAIGQDTATVLREAGVVESH